jgi:hypothetical protein
MVLVWSLFDYQFEPGNQPALKSEYYPLSTKSVFDAFMIISIFDAATACYLLSCQGKCCSRAPYQQSSGLLRPAVAAQLERQRPTQPTSLLHPERISHSKHPKSLYLHELHRIPAVTAALQPQNLCWTPPALECAAYSIHRLQVSDVTPLQGEMPSHYGESPPDYCLSVGTIVIILLVLPYYHCK